MSSSYPWIKDSQYGTTPLVTDYLQVTSPNGLYLNDTNSEVLLSNTTTTSEKLTIKKSSLDLFSSNGSSALLIDNTKIHLNEPSPTTTPFTTDITYQSIILQSKNFGTPTNTLTLQPSVIQHSTPSFNMNMGGNNGTYQTQATANNYTSTLTPDECRLGFDGSTNQGKLYCLDIDCGNNLNVLTINGLSVTTTGLIWADFANPYSSLPSNRYYLSDTTYETYQDVQQFYARNMSSNQSASYTWSGINTSGGTFTLQTNGYNFDLYCGTFNINGTPYSPGGGGGGVSDIQAGSGISVNQNTGSVTISNSGVTDIQAGSGISISQTTGSVTISNSGGGGGENLSTTLSYGNDAGGRDITSVNNINVNSINGSPYPPSVSIPQFIFAMPFQSGNVPDNSQTLFTSGVYITGGFTYAITWTFWYDGLYQSGGGVEMIHGYSDLQNSSGSVHVQGAAKSLGLWASSYVSTASGSGSYKTTITYTDNNYVINASDTYYPYVFQTNTLALAWGGTTYVSATISRTN
jgi:hypothetical protein